MRAAPSSSDFQAAVGAHSQLAVDAAHAVAAPPRFLNPLLGRNGVRLAAVTLQQHLPQQRLLFLRGHRVHGAVEVTMTVPGEAAMRTVCDTTRDASSAGVSRRPNVAAEDTGQQTRAIES